MLLWHSFLIIIIIIEWWFSKEVTRQAFCSFVWPNAQTGSRFRSLFTSIYTVSGKKTAKRYTIKSLNLSRIDCSTKNISKFIARSTASDLEQVNNIACAQANSASCCQWDEKWAVACVLWATRWRPNVADWDLDRRYVCQLMDDILAKRSPWLVAPRVPLVHASQLPLIVKCCWSLTGVSRVAVQMFKPLRMNI